MVTTRVTALGSRRPSSGVDHASSLPVIDLGPLLHGGPGDRLRVAEELGRAAREVGFFYVANHGIARHLIEDAYACAETFFSLPFARKLETGIARSKHHRGYVPVTERGDYADEQGARHYEAFDSGMDLSPGDVLAKDRYLVGPNVWPRLPGFREATTAYYRAATVLGQRLCRAFEMTLGLRAGFFDDFMDRPTSQLRYLHYLRNEDAPLDDDMNMGAHTDYECFTILHQRAPGLQVVNSDGRWIDAPPIDGTFVINIGDLLEVWTNGAFKSTLHRVQNNGHERYSMPFFVAANYDAVVRPIDGLSPARGSQRYAPVVAGHHLMNQLMRDFGYLKARYEANLMPLEFEVTYGNPYEQNKAQPLAHAA